MNLNIKVKIRAYQKGDIPTKLSQLENDVGYLTDAQGSIDKDGKVYARQNEEWVDISRVLEVTTIDLEENSGLNLTQDGSNYTLGIRKKELLETELMFPLENDTTYYVRDLTPTLFIGCGTSWSNGGNWIVAENEYNNEVNGGDSNQEVIDEEYLPINSQGVYNG